MNLFAGQKQRCRHREWTCRHNRGWRGWDELREWHSNICITMCKIETNATLETNYTPIKNNK